MSFQKYVCLFSGRTESSRLVSGQGLDLQDGTTEALKIHQENQAWLEGMSQREVLEEQQRLLAKLGGCTDEGVHTVIAAENHFTFSGGVLWNLPVIVRIL